MTHICVGNLTIIGSDNGLSSGRRQAIIWTNAGILLIKPLGTNFSEDLIKILTFSFTKMRLKVSSAKWRQFCLGLNVLKSPTHCGLLKTLSPWQSSCCYTKNIINLISSHDNFHNLIQISLKFISNGPMHDEPALDQIMAWCQTGGKPSSQAIMV